MSKATSLRDRETRDDGTRVYHYSDGRSFPSVTTVLDADPAKRDAINAFEESHPHPDQYRDQQGLLGSIVHHRIATELATGSIQPPELDMAARYDGLQEDVEICLEMWRDALDNHDWLNPGVTPHVETAVRSTQHEYAGTFDLLTDDRVLVDFKTSKRAYRSHKKQLGAYYQALSETADLPTPEKGAIVVLHPHIENNSRLSPQVARLSQAKLSTWADRFNKIRSLFRNREGEGRTV